jgi:hypothetical protein
VKEILVRKAFLVVLLAIVVVVPGLHAQQALRVARVLLYKNGMAYIVRTGQLAGPVSLTFHPEDMNDVLKSFSAWNPESGALYSVGYTAGIPSSHLLSRYPFDLTIADSGLGAFLMQVKGAEIRLDQGGRDVAGKLVAVQTEARVTAPQTSAPDYRLTVLLPNSSLQTVWLSDVRAVEFTDAQLKEQLRSYLEVLAAGRQDVTREVSVYPVPGPGPIQVAYLQQFPLWKTSYRVDLGAKESRIQGWAQIDNPTGEAWEGVTVSLLSGSPVSFKMNLYDPLYTTRTTVAVPGGQVAAPRQYETSVTAESSTAAQERVDVQNARQLTGTAGLGGGAAGGRGGMPPAPAAPAPSAFRELVGIAPGAGGFQQADAARIEDLYEYTFPFPVRIASRQSALLPFLQKTMPVERLSIFNARNDRGNPRIGARLENTSDIPLEAGPVTFFHDSRYSGEAVLNYLPRGEKALVSFGIDHEIQIAMKTATQPETMARLTIARGVATTFMETVATTTYEIRNRGTEQKSLIVEHSRAGNRALKSVTPFESTEGFHRFRIALMPGQSTTLEVPEIVSRQNSVQLTTLTRPQLALFTSSGTPAQVRERLGQIIDLQEQLASLRGQIKESQDGIDGVFRDQERLRENLKALGTGVEDRQLRTRYLGELQKQEDQLEAGRTRIAALNAQINRLQAQLGDLIATLSVG